MYGLDIDTYDRCLWHEGNLFAQPSEIHDGHFPTYIARHTRLQQFYVKSQDARRYMYVCMHDDNPPPSMASPSSVGGGCEEGERAIDCLLSHPLPLSLLRARTLFCCMLSNILSFSRSPLAFTRPCSLSLARSARSRACTASTCTLPFSRSVFLSFPVAFRRCIAELFVDRRTDTYTCSRALGTQPLLLPTAHRTITRKEHLHAHACAHAHAHTHTHTYTYTHLHAHTNTRTHTRAHTHIYS